MLRAGYAGEKSTSYVYGNELKKAEQKSWRRPEVDPTPPPSPSPSPCSKQICGTKPGCTYCHPDNQLIGCIAPATTAREVLAPVFSTELFIKISTALTVISYKLFFWMGAQCYDLGEMENDIADENKTGEMEKKDKKDKKGEEKIDGNVESKFQLPYFQRLDSNYSSASMLWLLPQFLLWGMMKGILEEGLEEFLHDHIDNGLQVQAVCGIVDTVGNFLSMILTVASPSSWRHMAQRTEKEETEFKVPETLTLCINNCGLTGNLATNNMCQKCFNATTVTTSSSPSSTANITTAGAVAVGPSVLTFSVDPTCRAIVSSALEPTK
ncbi:hypothetical protein SLEP1_g39603 [Rubroshorea leprosula]|uniref:A20-type domain-containing protein n=1 Tax=Rubroshorea leprosula TaxID=152421 RepID=A0AAV5L150_9ROSI|nr:hypothetical protein SLEP1_g39603 [Rubroshorea leprosula]